MEPSRGRTLRLASVLTVSANLAVVAGLVFVGVEVRNNRAAVESQIADGIAEGFIEHNLAAVTSPAVACIWSVGLHTPERLSDVQAAQFAMYFRAVFNQYIRVHALYETGLLDHDFWQFVGAQAAWAMSTPGGVLFFEGNPGVPSGFLRAVEVLEPVAADQLLQRPIPLACPEG